MDDDYCQRCDRDFPDEHALVQHLRNSALHRHACVPCRRHFDSAKARQQHLDYSRNHNICKTCNIDFSSLAKLDSHDVTEHNMCRDCGRYFNTPSNMQHHRQVHMDKNYGCPGCGLAFVSSAAMVLHLEAGTCPSGAGWRTVDKAALVSDSYGNFCTDKGDQCDFHCSACGKEFRYMSGLLQHINSTLCPKRMGNFVLGELDDFMQELSWRLGRY